VEGEKRVLASDASRYLWPKVVTINAEEGPAYGVALLAAAGPGLIKMSLKLVRLQFVSSRERT